MDWEVAFSLSDSARQQARIPRYSKPIPQPKHGDPLTSLLNGDSVIGSSTCGIQNGASQPSKDITAKSDQTTITSSSSTDIASNDAVAVSNWPNALKRCMKTRQLTEKRPTQQFNRKRNISSLEDNGEEDHVSPMEICKKDGEVIGNCTSLTCQTITAKLSRRRDERLHDTLKMVKQHGRLNADFYKCDALELAPRLLGKILRRNDVALQITEVEAYRPNDSACHGRFGITTRTAPLFGVGGHAYVYLCYGLHVMLNIVADRKGVGAAVLIRSCAPVAGLKTIQQRRGHVTDKPVLLTGPGKVGQALGLTTEWSNHPLYKPGGLEIIDGPAPENILVGPRVGIDYANPEDVAALWRFAIAESPWISAPRNTLRPA